MSMFGTKGLFDRGTTLGDGLLQEGLDKMMPEREQHPLPEPAASSSTIGRTVSTIGRTVRILRKTTSIGTAIWGARRVADPVLSSVKETVAPHIPESVSNFASTTTEAVAETTTKVTSPILETLGNIGEGGGQFFGYIKSTWSWGSWAFTKLPPGMQFGLGLGALWFAYTLWRGNRAQVQNVNVHVHVPKNLSSCDAVIPHTTTTDDGNGGKIVGVTLACAQKATPQTTAKTDQARKILRKGVRNILDARKLHKQLNTLLSAKRFNVLSLNLRNKTVKTYTEFNRIAGSKYQDPQTAFLVGEARTCLAQIDAQVQRAKNVLGQMRRSQA